MKRAVITLLVLSVLLIAIPGTIRIAQIKEGALLISLDICHVSSAHHPFVYAIAHYINMSPVRIPNPTASGNYKNIAFNFHPFILIHQKKKPPRV